MKIIILGADQVGAALAGNLVREDNEITVVDTNTEYLNQLQERFDLRVVQGYGAYPRVLREAGAEEADMLVAVTRSDETNLVACQVAHALFKKPQRIARIRSPEYLSVQADLFSPEAIPVDHLIMPEQLVIDHLYRIIEHPGALQVFSFCQGKVGLVSVKAFDGTLLVGLSLLSAQQKIQSEARIVALYRQNRPLPLSDNTLIQADDEIFLMAAFQHLNQIMSQLKCLEKPYKQVMIVGGGNIGAGLAQRLEKKYSVKLIERNALRARTLAEQLSGTMVFCGDASDPALLLEEHIEQIALFIAVTDDDEDNIMSAMLAKHFGAKKSIVLIQRSAYVDLLQGHIIDSALSPQQVTLSALLTYLRKADIVNVFSLRGGEAEAIEVIVRGDPSTSTIVGQTIDTIKWPSMVTIGALVREGTVVIAHNELVIETDDHLILFLTDCKQLTQLERLLSTEPEHTLSKYSLADL